MKDIKIRVISKGNIKEFNKSITGLEKVKNNVVKIKDNYQESNEENTEYATNRISNTISQTTKSGTDLVIYDGREHFSKSIENTKKVTKRILPKDKIKSGKVVIKTSKNTVKQIANSTKSSMKMAQKTMQISKEVAIKSVQATKVIIKATVSTIKGIIAAIKGLISLIIAGGWVAVVIIIVVCIIALIVSSVFGIFLSSENTNSINNVNQVITMSNVISDINTEFINKINDIKNNNQHSNYEIISNRAEWKDVLAIYAVKLSNGKDNADVVTLNDTKITLLKEIFWNMNNISFTKEEFENESLLRINITSKSTTEMASIYNFSNEQKEQLKELLSDKYSSLWSSVIYGTSVGNTDIVKVAVEQLGNIDGEKFWSWYGFSSRVEWCACFVSWCANECGYINSGIIPKFASCDTQGIPYFKSCGLWKDNKYIPKAGDIIFFDWQNDGISDHVGIVEKIENNKIYTIEGNSKNQCRRLEYNLYSNLIIGYGTPMY